MAKGTTKRTTARKTTARTSAKSEETAALKAEALAMTGAPDPQTGMTVTHPDDAPSLAAVKKARKAAVEEQFAVADDKGEPGFTALRRANSGF